MKKSTLIISIFFYSFTYSQSCNPVAFATIQNQFISTYVSNVGDIWSNPTVNSAGFEYPKRTVTQIANGDRALNPIFAGGIWLSSKEGSQINSSLITYRIVQKHFKPGPINLLTGKVDSQSCMYFDKIWIMNKSLINAHIQNWLNAASLPLTNIDPKIIEWPAKGNRTFTKVPIVDDMAPFLDVNNNGIYDPEYGDYPMIKGDESHFTVYNDIASGRLDSVEKPVGVEVQLLTSLFYSNIENGIGTALFHDCKIIKKTTGNANDFIFSLFVDTDLGNFNDDYVGCDTLSNSGFVYNADNFDEVTSINGYLANPPVVITSFINKKMGSFLYYINGTSGQNINPSNTTQYRNNMEGLTRTGNSYTISNDAITPGNPVTKFCFFGNPSDNSKWSMQSVVFPPKDIRYLMSTDKSVLEYNKPYTMSFVTYIHKFKTSSFKPNIQDTVIPKLNGVKSLYMDSLNCKITLTANITSDTNSLKKGKIDILTISNGTAPYQIKWSSNDITQNISGKNSGKYRVVIIDSKNCIKDSLFYIPLIKTTKTGIAFNDLESLSIFPIPFQNQISITNPERLKINKIVLFDIVGKQVKEFNFYNKNTKLELLVNELPQGNYILSIQSDSGEKNFRISK